MFAVVSLMALSLTLLSLGLVKFPFEAPVGCFKSFNPSFVRITNESQFRMIEKLFEFKPEVTNVASVSDADL